ncbi:MAG: helix-turn-helix domain-containing protein [Methanocellales archaeon]|nr:helix-turn-helix domain-containing protein [Methanocellales archaeon]MDI6902844.1 helix-turn-helix domain-containing protein [Methanocellales archaeon]
MGLAEEVIGAALESDERFQKTLNRVIKFDLRLSTAEFSARSRISPSTLYKILAGEREPSLHTLRNITSTIRQIEGGGGEKFIAVIAARPVLDKIEERRTKVDDKPIAIREYPAMSMEDAIVAAIRAERDGAAALVCAPIVSPTIEKVLHIPVATIMPKKSVARAIELAAKKMR